MYTKNKTIFAFILFVFLSSVCLTFSKDLLQEGDFSESNLAGSKIHLSTE